MLSDNLKLPIVSKAVLKAVGACPWHPGAAGVRPLRLALVRDVEEKYVRGGVRQRAAPRRAVHPAASASSAAPAAAGGRAAAPGPALAVDGASAGHALRDDGVFAEHVDGWPTGAVTEHGAGGAAGAGGAGRGGWVAWWPRAGLVLEVVLEVVLVQPDGGRRARRGAV